MREPLTLVVTVYNALRPLELIFRALRRQSFKNFDVVIADDGSGPEIADLVEAFRLSAEFPVTHVWHPDEGFRKNTILNRAIAEAKSGYLVFIDGDCVPQRNFLEDHGSFRRPGTLLCGRRVNLGRRMSEKITPEAVSSGAFERLTAALLLDGLRGNTVNLEDAVRVTGGFLGKLFRRKRASILGCNFSVQRELLERVNGFDERYVAPGLGEDSDLALRLSREGVRMRSLKNLAVLFHLYHPPTPVGEENKRLYDETVRTGESVCRNGIRKITE